jgi:hypothetical protein
MKKITAILISITLIYSCAPNKNVVSPFAGTWEINLDGCIETWVYDSNGIRKSYSGEEETVNKFTFSKLEEGKYEVIDTRISSNSKVDCTGQTSDIPNGHVATNIIKFLDKDTLILCSSEDCLDNYQFKRKK